MSVSTRTLLLRSLVMLSLLASSAWAGKAAKRARVLYEQGAADVRAGRYEDAIAAFEKANLLAPSSALLFNIGQTYRLMGDCERAHEAYLAYLDANPNARNRKRVKDRVAEMKACAQERNLVALADGVGDEPVDESESVPVMPAPRRADRGGVPRGRTKQALGIGGGLLGATAVGLGFYYTSKANDAQDEVDRFLAAGGTWNATYAALEDRRDSAKKKATYLYGTGAAMLVGGAVLYYLGWRESVTVTVTPYPGGGQLGLAARF